MKSAKVIYLFLGSSVTYGYANGGVSFVDYVSEQLGVCCIKEAVNGTTLAHNGGDSYVARLRALNAERADGLIVQLSTNDVSKHMPRGIVADGFGIDSFDVGTTLGAIEYIIAYAKERWGCAVSFYTNPPFGNADYEELIEGLDEIAEKWGIDVVDFYRSRGMERLSAAELSACMADPVHPNDRGYRYMSGVFCAYLRRKFPEFHETDRG